MADRMKSDEVDTTSGLFLRGAGDAVRDVFTIVYVDLAGLGRAAETLDRQVLMEVSTAAKKAIRAAQSPFGGTEFDKSAGIGVIFQRPIDAVGYSLSLLDALGKLQDRFKVPLLPRIGIDFGQVEVQGLDEARNTRSATTLHVHGEPLQTAAALMRKAEVGHALLSRAAFDLAKSTATANETIPPGTRWIRHGRSPLGKLPQPVDICEVAPAAPNAGKPEAAGQTMLMAFEFGASQLVSSLGSGPKRSLTSAEVGSRTAAGLPALGRAEELLGTSLGNFRIEGLKSGDQGRWSYVAHDVELRRDVHLRVLPPDDAKDHLIRSRFLREGMASMFLQHPNLAAGYESGRKDGLHFLAGELVRGVTLREMVEVAGSLDPKLTLGYAIQVARALCAVHAGGIIHRDIQPDSLIATQQGVVKIQSFALAKVRDTGDLPGAAKRSGDDAPIGGLMAENLTAMNTALGNPEFSAPEQLISAADVDYRADQYSLGCLIVFLLTGEPPVKGTSAFEVRARVGSGVKAPLKGVESVPPGLESVVLKLLARDPEARFKEMGEVLEALEKIQGVRPVTVAGAKGAPSAAPVASASPQSPLAQAAHEYNTASWRRLRIIGVFGLLALLIAGGVVIGVAQDFPVGMGLLGLAFLAPAFHLLLDGLFFHNPLFRRFIRLFAHPSPLGIAIGVGLVALIVGGLYLLGLLAIAGIVVLSALVLAIAWQLFVLLPLKFQRSQALRTIQEQLKQMRQEGQSEDKVREIIFEAAGANWEELFEALFGYDAKIAMRAEMRGANRLAGRRRFAAWRDGIAAWLVEIEEARAEARTQRTLQEAEEERLATLGVPANVAKKQAQAEAARQYQAEREAYAAPMMQHPGMGMGYGGPLGRGYGQPGMMRDYYGGKSGPVRWFFNSLRTAIGTGIMLGYMGPKIAAYGGIQIPPLVMEYLAAYYKWGFGGTFYAMVIGGIVLQGATSSRYFTSTLTALGGLLLVTVVPVVKLVNNNPPFDSQMAIFAGATLIFLGYGVRHMTSVGGMRRLMPF
ncbi:protein kinase [bacterium]|nr:protein kinase [bacterium]